MAVLRGAPSSTPLPVPVTWGAQAQAVRIMVQHQSNGGRDPWMVASLLASGYNPFSMTPVQFHGKSLAMHVALGHGLRPSAWQQTLNSSETELPYPELGEHASSQTLKGAQHADKGTAVDRQIDAVLFMEETIRRSVGSHRFYGAAPGERMKLPSGMLHL